MIFKYSKLRGRIREVCQTQEDFADLIGVSKTSLSAKLNNKVVFTQAEIHKAADVLKILPEEIYAYFFTTKV